MAFMGLIGSLMLPVLVHSWILMATVLLFWGGCVAGLYTVGLSHLGSRLTGSDLAAANAAFVFCYAVGTVAGPQVIGAAIDVAGNDGFALGYRRLLRPLCPAFRHTGLLFLRKRT